MTVGKKLNAADAAKLTGLRAGGGTITPEVEAGRAMEIGDVLHLDQVKWELNEKTGKPVNTKQPADKVANRLSTDASKKGYKVRTRKVLKDGPKDKDGNTTLVPAGLLVTKIDPEAENGDGDDDEDDGE